ncbi:hypothetical protein C8J38_101651 [Rhizobium sp. PP-WC-2G-219]|nr:hypothetical protein C8J32_101964 [Rhizobium sp. PP-CC-3A-592]PYE46540.1 hypothetical protein DFI02_101683 [Rhizobium sp. PP-F2F-G20b]TCL96293.1 hypothetical protein C8J38_101651 [Rhizobium sp. PP-WC-2G-219]
MAIPTLPAGIARLASHVMHFIHHRFRAAHHAPRFSIEQDDFTGGNVNGILTRPLSGVQRDEKG